MNSLYLYRLDRLLIEEEFHNVTILKEYEFYFQDQMNNISQKKYISNSCKNILNSYKTLVDKFLFNSFNRSIKKPIQISYTNSLVK